MSRGGIGSTSERLERIREHTKGSDSPVSSFGLAPKLPSELNAEPTVQRSTDTTGGATRAGEAQIPDSVRGVISSPGHSLDSSLQGTLEDRMGDSFGNVRIHTGPQAARACDAINARAFTVGNHIAFNAGEYEPTSAEGQYLLAHELTHVRQQTGGAISMLPESGAELEIDPDLQLEREADEAAKEALRGEQSVVVSRMGTEVQIQRVKEDQVETLTDIVAAEIESGENDSNENKARLEALLIVETLLEQREGLNEAIEETKRAKIGAEVHADVATDNEAYLKEGQSPRDFSREKEQWASRQERLAAEKERLQSSIANRLESIGTTDAQEKALKAEIGYGEILVDTIISMAKSSLGLEAMHSGAETVLRKLLRETSGTPLERLRQVRRSLINKLRPDDGGSQGVGQSGEVEK